MSGIKHAIPLIQAVNRKVEGLSAPDNYPRTLSTGVTPIALTFPGRGSSVKRRSGLKSVERNFVVEVYVDPVTQGAFDDPLQHTIDLLDQFVEMWLGLINEEEEYIFDYGAVSGYDVRFDRFKHLMDSGPRMDMEWFPKTTYFGFTAAIPILIRWGDKLL